MGGTCWYKRNDESNKNIDITKGNRYSQYINVFQRLISSSVKQTAIPRGTLQ